MTSPQSYANGGNNDRDDAVSQAGQVQINTEGVDSLLDEIDDLLESNAEEFVRAYVQKGGE